MTLLMPPPGLPADTITIHVPEHAGELVEVEAPRPEPHLAPTPPPKTLIDYLPWMLLVGLAALMIGLLAGMMIAPQRVVYRSTGWTPAAYSLAHEHLAQAPVSPAATSLAREHLAQAPVPSAATSLEQEHQNLAP